MIEMNYTSRAVTLSDTTWNLLRAMSGARTISGTIEAVVAEAGALREKALQNALAIRGSYDAPGFDACVAAEYQALVAETEAEVPHLPGPRGAVGGGVAADSGEEHRGAFVDGR